MIVLGFSPRARLARRERRLRTALVVLRFRLAMLRADVVEAVQS